MHSTQSFLSKMVSSVIFLSLIGNVFFPLQSFAATTLVDGSDVEGIPDSNISITDLQVSADSGSDVVPVSLFVPSGTLQMSTTTGLTFTGASSGSQLYFSGTATNVNAALATLYYTNSSTGTFTLEATIVTPGQVYDPTTQHVYEVIDNGSTISGGDARNAALARSINGVSGYLANITSEEENEFVAARITRDGWFGASDAETEGTWKWLDGPEAGTTFWVGTGDGDAFGYENWANNEPNQSGDEDCSQFYANGSGWNDLSCSGSIRTYIVEYGAPGDLPTIPSSTLDITVAEDVTPPIAPTIIAPSGINNQYPTISGTCETGATVSISISPTDEEIDVVCVASAYSVTPTEAIPYGEYSVEAYQTDPSSNEGPTASASNDIMNYGVGGGGGSSGSIEVQSSTVEEQPSPEEIGQIDENDKSGNELIQSDSVAEEFQEVYIDTLDEDSDVSNIEDTGDGQEEDGMTGDEVIVAHDFERHYRLCEMGVDLLSFGEFELNGICEGFFEKKDTDTTSYYQQEVSRQEIIAVAVSMLRNNKTDNTEASLWEFEDVNKDEQPSLASNIQEALRHELITTSRTVFEPGRSVTRAEAYAIIMPTVCLYPSGAEDDIWQKKVHNIAYKKGITQFAWDEFQPERHIFLQELFVIVSRVADWAEETGGCSPRIGSIIED